MIPKETVERILDTAQIVDVVGDFVSLKRRGANFVACCPFHNEKTPSFYVSPAKGIYKCFGCGKSGTAVGFVMEHENLSYTEALRYLARKYGIEVVEKEESAEEIAKRQRSESLYLVSEFAAGFFRDSLSSGEGRAVGYAYFKSRKLEDSTIARFGLGWSPSGRYALADAALIPERDSRPCQGAVLQTGRRGQPPGGLEPCVIELLRLAVGADQTGQAAQHLPAEGAAAGPEQLARLPEQDLPAAIAPQAPGHQSLRRAVRTRTWRPAVQESTQPMRK